MEILSKIQKEALSLFSQAKESENFYLTGGTALAAFYLNHRRSNDLDFFTSVEELILPFSYQLEEILKSAHIGVERRRGFRSFAELLLTKGKETTIIHLAQDTPFRLEATREFPEYPGLKLDSLVDIAANKLLALFSRATLRDFIDVYFLVNKAKFTQGQLIKKSKIKDPGFDLYWLGVAFERINSFAEDSADMLLLAEPCQFKEIVNFFKQWREKISRELT